MGAWTLYTITWVHGSHVPKLTAWTTGHMFHFFVQTTCAVRWFGGPPILWGECMKIKYDAGSEQRSNFLHFFYKIQKCLDAEKLFILKQQKVTINLQRLLNKSIIPLTSLAPWSQLTTLDVFYWIRAMIWTVDHEYFKLTGTCQWYLTLVRNHLCMCSANEKWYYIVKSSLIGTAHTQNDPRWV